MNIDKEIVTRYYAGGQLKAYVLDNDTPIDVYQYLFNCKTDIMLVSQKIALSDISADKLRYILPLSRGGFDQYKLLWQSRLLADDVKMIDYLYNKCKPTKKELYSATAYCAQNGNVDTLRYLYSQLTGGKR